MKSHSADDPIESALRSDALRLCAPAPIGLERRVSEAVARSGREGATGRRPTWVWISALATAGGFAAALVLTLRVEGKKRAEDRAASASLAAVVKTMPAQLWHAVQPEAQAALQNDPLQSEATALYADARSALGFLAYNFLPGTAGPVVRGG